MKQPEDVTLLSDVDQVVSTAGNASPDSTSPHPQKRPRVWPVFIAYAGTLLFSLVFGIVVLIVELVSTLPVSQLQDQELLQAHVDRLGFSPRMLAWGILANVVVLTVLSLLFFRDRSTPWRTRLRLQPAGLRVVTLAALGTFSLGHICAALLTLGPGIKDSAMVKIGEALHNADPLPFSFVALGASLAGIAEEFFFRGVMQTRFRTRWSVWTSILVTAFLFGLLHMDPYHAAFAFALGVFLGWVVEQTGSIVPAIVAHVFNNTVAWILNRWIGDFDATVFSLLASSFVLAAAVWLLTRSAPKHTPPTAVA